MNSQIMLFFFPISTRFDPFTQLYQVTKKLFVRLKKENFHVSARYVAALLHNHFNKNIYSDEWLILHNQEVKQRHMIQEYWTSWVFCTTFVHLQHTEYKGFSPSNTLLLVTLICCLLQKNISKNHVKQMVQMELKVNQMGRLLLGIYDL